MEITPLFYDMGKGGATFLAGTRRIRPSGLVMALTAARQNF
jgi:hypothetical protein